MELSTHIVRLNLAEIKKNILNKEYWGSKWVLFDNGSICIAANLHQIGIQNNQFTVYLEGRRLSREYGSFIYVSFAEGNETSDELFHKQVTNKVKSFFHMMGADYLKMEDEFTELRGHQRVFDRKIKDLTAEFIEDFDLAEKPTLSAIADLANEPRSYINYYDELNLVAQYVYVEELMTYLNFSRVSSNPTYTDQLIRDNKQFQGLLNEKLEYIKTLYEKAEHLDKHEADEYVDELKELFEVGGIRWKL